MNRAKKTGNRGFSIIEMLVVVAIIGILASVTLPTLGSWFNEFRLTQFSNALLTTFKTLRIEAISRERRTRAVIDIEDDFIEFQILDLAGENWETLETLDPVRAPGGVFINSVDNTESESCEIIFTPIGGTTTTCGGNSALHLNHEGAGRDDDCRLRTIYFSSMRIPGGVLVPFGAYGIFDGTYANPPDCAN